MGSGRDISLKAFFNFISIAIILGVNATLPKTIKGLKLIIKHGPIEFSMKEIGIVVANTLYHMKLIETDLSKLNIQTDSDKNGIVYCWMDGGSNYEKSCLLVHCKK